MSTFFDWDETHPSRVAWARKHWTTPEARASMKAAFGDDETWFAEHPEATVRVRLASLGEHLLGPHPRRPDTAADGQTSTRLVIILFHQHPALEVPDNHYCAHTEWLTQDEMAEMSINSAYLDVLAALMNAASPFWATPLSE